MKSSAILRHFDPSYHCHSISSHLSDDLSQICELRGEVDDSSSYALGDAGYFGVLPFLDDVKVILRNHDGHTDEDTSLQRYTLQHSNIGLVAPGIQLDRACQRHPHRYNTAEGSSSGEDMAGLVHSQWAHTLDDTVLMHKVHDVDFLPSAGAFLVVRSLAVPRTSRSGRAEGHSSRHRIEAVGSSDMEARRVPTSPSRTKK